MNDLISAVWAIVVVAYPLSWFRLFSSADVVSIEKTNENFRIIYDVKGRFAIHRITAEEAKYKLCKVKKVCVGLKGVPSIVTSDGRTIRYPDPLIKVNDTVKISIDTGKIDEFIKFDSGEIHSGTHRGSIVIIK